MNNSLYHSNVYLGEDYSDGIRHYKYLKKVRTSGGGWRYIYDESELKKNERISKDVEKQARSSDGYSYGDKHGGTTTHRVEGHGILYSEGTSRFRLLGSSSKQTTADKIKEARWRIYKKHAKQKIKDIPKRAISKGIAYVSNLKYKIEKRWVK